MFPLIEEDENSEDLNVATGASCPQAPGRSLKHGNSSAIGDITKQDFEFEDLFLKSTCFSLKVLNPAIE